MGCGCERELQWHHWQGLRIVQLAEFPPTVAPQLNYNLIVDSIYQGVSLELCLSGGHDALKMFVVIRGSDVSRAALVRKLDDSVDQFESQLNSAGFRVVHPEEDREEMEKLLLPCSSEISALYHVPETQQEYYVPADMGRIAPLDWPAISQVLTDSNRAVFSVHLMPAVYTNAEKQVIADNCRYFAQQSQEQASAHLQQCEGAYQKLQANAAEQMLFLAVSMHGDVKAEHKIAALMNRVGLTRLVVSGHNMSASEDWLDLPFVLAEILAVSGHTYRQPLAPALRRFSHLISKSMAGALTAFPRRMADIRGIYVSSRPENMQPLPDIMTNSEGLPVGTTAGRQNVYIPASWMPLHAMIVGMPGMGKTTYAIGLLNNLWKQGYPFLVIEPTKTEYRRMLDCIPDLQIYTAGRADLAPIALNPFLPPKGITLEQFKPSLISVFMAAFSMTSPLDVIFPDVVNECYTRYGWRNNSTRDSEGVTVFGLHEFIQVFRESVRRSHYDPESKANLESGGVYRLQALLNSNPMLYDTDHSLPYEELLKKPTVIELDAIDNQEQKSLIMSILLINLMLTIRKNQGTDGRFKNAIMIDEAHLLLGDRLGAANEESAKSSQSAVQLLKNWVVTIRAYGTGLIFADQSPQKLTGEIVSNCNFKTIFHLDSAQDRSLLANDTGLTSEMIQEIRTLHPGEAYISCNKLRQPVRVQTPNYGAALKLRAYVSDEELRGVIGDFVQMQKPFASCSKNPCCAEGCNYACRAEGEFLARSICSKVMEALQDAEGIRSVLENREELVDAAIQSLSADYADRECLRHCTAMQLLRRIQLISHVSYPWPE